MFRQTLGMVIVGSLVGALSDLADLSVISTALCLVVTALAMWLMTSTKEGEE